MKIPNKNQADPKPLNFVGALQISFIVLKLTDHIDWGWLWVFMPTWIIYGLFGFLLAVSWAIKSLKKRGKE